MRHVVTRASSVIDSAWTMDTLDGTGSPWRLKLTTYTNSPDGLTCNVAGNMPSVTRPTGWLVVVEYFQSAPFGWPCAIDTKSDVPAGSSASPCGPSMSTGITPVSNCRSTW